MRKLCITFISICLILHLKSSPLVALEVIELPLKNQADSVMLRSMRYMIEDNQRKLLEKQDSLINLLN